MNRSADQRCAYVRRYYGVPAEIGRRLTVGGKPGIIVADRGAYIGVNFDADKPTVISPAHPTSQVEYLEMGTPRNLTRAQQRSLGERVGESRQSKFVGNSNDKRELQPQGSQREEWRRSSDPSWWLAEPNVGRVAHGVPARVDRLRALGNAVVPQIPEIIGRAIMKQLSDKSAGSI